VGILKTISLCGAFNFSAQWPHYKHRITNS